MIGDMYIARSIDEELQGKAECGGAVTSLLKFALESHRVDAVITVKARDGNRYDGVPALIRNPKELMATSGTLHCSSPNITRFLKEYLNGAFDEKIAVVVKPCDAKAIIELAKRDQINLDNLVLIGLNCTGTLPSSKAKEIMRTEFQVDPADVIAEDIEENKLTIILSDGVEKEVDLAELEDRGYGRRENCRRCETNIPRMADIACGKWGTRERGTTFIEVCSGKGSELIEGAVEARYLRAEPAGENDKETRRNKDEAASELAKQWQEKDFASLREMSKEDKHDYWFKQFSHCIKCYGCRDACPICYCKHCYLEADRCFIPAGEVPPDTLFPILRIDHVMDSCVNCGQCQDVCTMELPLSRFIFMLSKELSAVFGYEPGASVDELPPMRSYSVKAP